MKLDPLQALLGFQGLITLFLICLFWVLYSKLRRQEFFWWWSCAWTSYGVFLAADRIATAIPREWPELRQSIFIFSLIAAYVQVPLLLFGVRNLGHGEALLKRPMIPRLTAVRWLALLGATALATLSFAASKTLTSNPVECADMQNALRFVLLSVTFLYCSVSFLRWGWNVRTAGPVVAAVACACAAVDKLTYAISSIHNVTAVLNPQLVAPQGEPLLGRMTWFLLDAGWEMGLGLAMVLLLIEQDRRSGAAERNWESRYAHIFNNTSEGVVVTSLLDGRVIEVNETFLRLFGYRREEVVGHSSEKLGFWADPALRQRVVETVARGGQVAEFEGEFRTRTGEGRTVLICAAPIEINGTPCVMGMGRDITERKLAQKHLDERTNILSALVENNPLAIVVLDKDDRVQLVNRAFELLFRYTAEEARGKNLDDLIAPDDERETAGKNCAQLLSGENIHARGRRRRRDGGMVDVELYGVPIRAEGQVVGAYVLYQDITARRLAEELLRESEERYRDLFENASDLVFTTSPEGALVYVNPAFFQTLGYSESEIVGLTIERILHPRSLGAYRAARTRLLAGEHLDDLSFVLVTHNGGEILAEGSCSCRFQDERPVFIRSIFRDVTERRKAEGEVRLLNEDLERRVLERTGQLAAVNRELEARNREVERANRLKSQFLASMSHELRTPLNAVIGFSDLLNEETAGPLNGKQKRYVEHILNGARNLLQLINDILDLSKVEAGQLLLRPEEFSLAEALPEVLSTVKPLAMSKQIQVDPHVAADMRLYVDRIRLKQVLYNLLSNAIKFTPDGGLVRIEARPAGSLVCISVTDNGIGIPPEEHEAIFNEFHQVGMTTKGVREGTGLGLAISRRLVEAQEGKIWVESTPGHGSKFSFTLPAAAGPVPTPTPQGVESGTSATS
jgi:PAS domain S-box-containing protein